MYRFLVSLIGMLIALAAGASTAAAAPGQLDPAFGVGGLSAPPAPVDNSYGVFGVGIQPGGKIVTASRHQFLSGPVSVALQRADQNGAPDDTFGVGGVGLYSPPSGQLALFAMAVSDAGRIAVAGYRTTATSQVFVALFNADGTLDPSFDGDISNTCEGNGIVCTAVDPVDGQDQGRAVTFDGSGRVVVAGASVDSSGYVRMGVVRYTTTGALDSDFSGDGKAQVQVGPWSSWANAVAIRPDGDIMLAGVSQGQGPNWDGVNVYADALGLVRLDDDGSIDPQFHSVPANYVGPAYDHGAIISPRAEWTYGAAYALALAPGGNVIATGYANNVSPAPSASSVVAVRVDENGSLDPSFGTAGRAHVEVGGQQAGRTVSVDPLGRALIAGYTDLGGPQPTLALRLTPGGALDTSFNATGYRVFGVEDVGGSPSGVLDADGRWLLAGGRPDSRWGIVRLLTADDPPLAPEPAKPFVKISAPTRKSLKAKKLRAFAGTAGPAGAIKKIEIALQLKDAKLLKRQKHCRWLSSSKAKFKRVKATKRKCSRPVWKKASGTTKWKFKLSKRLPAASYRLSARVTLTDGRTAVRHYSFKLKKR